jgi:transcriptional regulator with XRE-family HTH domain
VADMDGFHGRLNELIQIFGGGKENAFAEKMGVKPENVNKWTNRGSRPSFEQLENFATRLNVNLNWLVAGRGDMLGANPVYERKTLEPTEVLRPKQKYLEHSDVSLMDVGARLKQIRGSLSLKEAADKSGISASVIKNCEAGKQKPDPKYLYWAAGYGHIYATWIETGENPAEHRIAAEEKSTYGRPITPEERDILELYRSASQEIQKSVKFILKNHEDAKKS